MAIYDYPAKYFADDKDVFDLLSENKFTLTKLLKLARSRGIYLSPKLPKETVVEYLSQLPFGWTELVALIKELETEEHEDSISFVQINTDVEPDAVVDAIRSVQQTRGQLNSEVYTIDPTTDGASVAVKYRLLNHKSTRALQWTDHRLSMTVQKKEGGYEVRFAASARGKEIVDKLVNQFPDAAPGAEKLKTISLKGVTDSKQKNKFFRELIYGMKNYRVDNVQDIRLNKIVHDGDGNLVLDTKNLSASDDEKGTAKVALASASGPGRVKKTTLTGDSLFQTPHFQQFCDEGFLLPNPFGRYSRRHLKLVKSSLRPNLKIQIFVMNFATNFEVSGPETKMAFHFLKAS